jgi:cation/acetate symporter
MLFWIGLLQLIVVVGGSLAIALWVLNRLFPPIERSRDLQSSVSSPPGRADAATPVVESAPPAPSKTSEVAQISTAPPWLGSYWRANLRLITPYVLIWLFSFTLPALLAPALNHISVLTGFPLGYYMGAQGTLIIFIILTLLYSWRMRRLDRQYAIEEPIDAAERVRRRRILLAYAGFVVGLVLLIAVISLLELFFHIPVSTISWFFLLADNRYLCGDRAAGAYPSARRVLCGRAARARHSQWPGHRLGLDERCLVHQHGRCAVPAGLRGPGLYHWLDRRVSCCWHCFWPLTCVSSVSTPSPTLSGRVTRVPATRVISAVIAIMISFTYVTAQVTGVGIIMSRFLGVNYMLGVIVGLSAVLLCTFLGGMQAITWTQGVQGIILMLAYLVPVTWLSVRITGVPLPQLMYGQAMHQIEALEVAQGIQSYSQPFNDWTPWNFVALTLCLMLGTCGNAAYSGALLHGAECG